MQVTTIMNPLTCLHARSPTLRPTPAIHRYRPVIQKCQVVEGYHKHVLSLLCYRRNTTCHHHAITSKQTYMTWYFYMPARQTRDLHVTSPLMPRCASLHPCDDVATCDFNRDPTTCPFVDLVEKARDCLSETRRGS